MNNDPIEAFDWLLAAFRCYIRNEINWLDVRKILDMAEVLRTSFEQHDTSPAEKD